jgi:DnaJ-class molecular chaperone
MDYYSILGVERNADEQTIKKAYKRLAMKHHPDKGGDENKFKEINEAYATLSDPQKRSQYDNPHQGGFGFSHGAQGFDFNDIFGAGSPFDTIFQRHRNQTPMFRTPVQVSLRQAYTGAQHAMELQTNQGKKVINVTIPKGVETGQQIRYDNIMGPGSILIIDFYVQPDHFYERKGPNLYSKYDISVLDLIAGHKFKFTTLSGTVLEVKIKPGTQPNSQIKLPGYGMPTRTGQYGDQIILLNPIIPAMIDKSITDAIAKYKEIEDLKHAK